MADLWQQSQEGATKKMTRQHTDCLYTNATKFIKSCFTYSCDKHTNTSHTGSHQHYEPVNIMPKIGWASSTLPTKLGGTYSRSMGTPNCGWLPTRTDNSSLPGPCAPSNKVFTKEQGPDNHRGSRTTGQRGNLGDTTYTTELCVSNFPGGKKGWGSETCDKPKGFQSICEDRALQDGRPSPTPRSLTATRLDGKDGSEGCLPSDPYSSRPSTPSHLPMGREDLHVSMPTLWSLSSTQSVHKTAETGGRLPEKKWLSPHNILRRHATATPGQGPTTTGDPTHLPIVGELGVNGKPEKSILKPTQELEFLGFHLCSVKMRLLIPSEKLRKIQQDARHLWDRESVSVREIARFVGKATATMRAIPLAPLHYRALQLLMNSVLPLNYTQEEISTKYETVVTLTPASKKDLEWWIDLKKAPLGAPVYHPDPTITIHSDASNKGWGAVLNGQSQTGGLWSPEEATHHINYLELLAAFLAIKAFGKAWQNVTILLQMDNVTAVSYINQKGGTVSQLLCQLALTIWTWCVERNITLLAEHLLGHLNLQADEESRTAKDHCDWMLNQSIFQRINSVMGPLEMDLFASGLTKQLPRFNSWKPDPEAEATDAFKQNWAAYRGFANPPWCLIHRCLTKLKKQTARMVLITPLWKTQPWYPLLLELLEDLPRRIPHQPDLVVMPQGQEFLMQQGVPQLVAWPISGNPIHHEVFLRRLQTSCLHHGETKLTPTMAPHSLSGLAGVSRGVEIPFQDL